VARWHRSYSAAATNRAAEDGPVDLDTLDEGVAVLDVAGPATPWNSPPARIVECPRERVVGRSLVAAIPGLSQTTLWRAISESQKDGVARTLEQIEVKCASGPRTLCVKIQPEADRVTVLWHDITERARATQARERSEQRLALLAQGANDGLW